MDLLTESLRGEWEALIRLMPRLAVALAVFIVFVAVGRLLGRALVRVLQRGELSPIHEVFFRNVLSWSFGLVGLVVGLSLLGLQAAAAGLIAGGGVSAVVLGFAFRGIGENLLAGLFLAFSRPFELGDLVKSGEYQGAVRGIALRYTHIRAADGRDVFIPSTQIFNEPLVNFTRDGLRRLSFGVGIDYSNDPLQAQELLVGTVGRERAVLPEPAPAVVVSELLPNYVQITVSFWLDALTPGTNLGGIQTRVMAACARALRENGFILSTDVTTNVAMEVREPVLVQLK